MPEPTSNSSGGAVRLRKPANTAFKQQRLKAWQPILTPRTVLPTFFLLGLIFIPLGAWLFTVSNSVEELSFDYTKCRDSAPPTNGPVTSWSYQNGVCTIQFNVKATMKAPVFLYYRLTEFYQNHRRYVKSVSGGQLKGVAAPLSDLSDCAPLSGNASMIYYPCGLIANSMFNDNIGASSDPTVGFNMKNINSNTNYEFSCSEIAWPSDQQKYGETTYDLKKIMPPKDWIGKRYGSALLTDNPWSAQTTMFNPLKDEHFQGWMRTAGLPTFRKLYGRSDNQLAAGDYELKIEYNFDVTGFKGTKSIVISTSTWLGGKNPFLGIAYMAVGGICVVLGIVFLIKHQISPRKLGDHTYLSWNQPAAAAGGRSE